MFTLLLVGFLAGLVTGISPCVLPVLPVVLAGGAAGRPSGGAAPILPEPGATSSEGRRRHRRPFAVVGGLVSTYCLFLLVGESLLSFLGLPQTFLEDLGIAMLVALGVGLLIPEVGTFLERPFARLGGSRIMKGNGGFLLGASLGLVFVPCAGPVQAALDAVVGRHHVGGETVAVTAAYGLGLAVPLLIVALLGDRIGSAWPSMRKRAVLIRRTSGVLLVALAILIAFNVTDSLAKIPGYTDALQRSIEATVSVTHQLQALQGEKPGRFTTPLPKSKGGTSTVTTTTGPSGKPGPSVVSTSTSVKDVKLTNYGPAPTFTGITAWLHTAGNQPISLKSLRGKVVLVDFWTYSCINCERSLPHVEAWYSAYKKDGFEVIGVHTPEFPFEYVVSNVRGASKRLGVTYPVAVDDNYGTWNAYSNEYWPAEYLIDQNGNVRHTSFGEGEYSTTEKDIRLLLSAGGAHGLPTSTNLPDRTPQTALTTETYLGTERFTKTRYVGSPVNTGATATHTLAQSVPANAFSLGGTWTEHKWDLVAGKHAVLTLSFMANEVYLVLGGHGTVTVTLDGKRIGSVAVHGLPDIYTMVRLPEFGHGTLQLGFSPGVQGYDFTFG